MFQQRSGRSGTGSSVHPLGGGWLRAAAMAALFSLACAAPLRAVECDWISAGGVSVLVKTSCDGHIIIWDFATNSRDLTSEVVSLTWTTTSFAGDPDVPVWTGADSGVHTANPIINQTPANLDEFPGKEGPFRVRTSSLKDRGLYTMTLSGTQAKIGPGGAVSPLLPSVFTFDVFNSSPSGSITISGTKKVGNTLTFASNLSDPDGGAFNRIAWKITTRPTGSTGVFSSSITASPTLALSSASAIGNWAVELKAADNEGEMITRTQSFTVVNQPPVLTITGPVDIDALEDIQLTAGPTTDADGEPVSLVWDVLQSPAASGVPVQNSFSTGTVINIPTGPQQIGVWKFRCTGKDPRNATDVETVTVEVHAIPPEINIEGEEDIDVGGIIDLRTTILDDAYGGPLQFNWDIIQSPMAAGAGLPTGFSLAPGLTIPTTPAHAGTWRFKLTVKDQVNETAEKEISVVVDALPTAVITGPAQSGSPLSGVELRGDGSFDPDSRNAPPDYGHLHAGPVEDISLPEIQTHRWNVLDVPPELHGTHFPGSVADVLGVDGSGPVLTLGGGDIPPGDWVFELVATDAEGNESRATHAVKILDQGMAPISIVSQPQFITTNLSGVLPDAVTVDGRFSFDLDNIFTQPATPGLGITNYAWSLAQAPAGCGSLPVLGSGPTATHGFLYPGGLILPGACQGVYNVALTVTDDDLPTARTDTATSLVLIGNCPGDLCIDNPTTLFPEQVRFSNYTDVVIYYHLNSVLYDVPAFAFGLRAWLQIFHEDNLLVPAYDKTFDLDMLPSNRGGALAMHWSGYDNFDRRPASGKYTVTLQLLDAFNVPVSLPTSQPESIWIQTLDVAVSSAAERYARRDELAAGSDTLRVPYTVVGANPGVAEYDELRYRIYRAGTHTLVYQDARFGPFAQPVLDWNGNVGGVTISTGAYDMELEILDNGESLGVSAPHPFTVYHLAVSTQPTGVPLPGGLRLAANSDDDDYNGIADMVQIGAAPNEDDLVPVHFICEPALPGTLTLTAGPAGLLRGWSSAAKTAVVPFPHTVPATSGQVFAEVFAPGRGQIGVSVLTTDGVTLGPSSFTLTAYDAAVMNDVNGDFAITAADNQTWFVRPGLWDVAFRQAADMFGGVDSIFDEEDATRLAAAANPQNFIGTDARRFYFRVADPGANLNPGLVEELPVANFEWYTLRSTAPLVNEDFPPNQRGLTLRETGVNSGVFVSQAVMVVMDPVDVTTATNSGLPSQPGRPLYDRHNHRTRRITDVDAVLAFKYRPLGAPGAQVERRLPVFQRVPDERRSITLHLFNFADPLNLGIPATTQGFIDLSTQTAKARLGAIGIRTRILYNPVTDVLNLPMGSPINLSSVVGFTLPGAFNTLTPSADQTALINMTAALETGADVIRLMFIDTFNPAAGSRGQSFPDGWLTASSTAPANFVFVANTAANRYTPVHEVVHMLTNAAGFTAGEAAGTTPGWDNGGHYGGVHARFNLMRSGTVDNGTPDDTKRLWDDTAVHLVQQITRIRGTRFIKNP